MIGAPASTVAQHFTRMSYRKNVFVLGAGFSAHSRRLRCIVLNDLAKFKLRPSSQLSKTGFMETGDLRKKPGGPTLAG